MLYDPENPVVQLCAKGIEIEYSGDLLMAGELYRRAWDEAMGPLDRSTAAHYIARVQETPEESLRWNLMALEQAEQVRTIYWRGRLPERCQTTAMGI